VTSGKRLGSINMTIFFDPDSKSDRAKIEAEAADAVGAALHHLEESGLKGLVVRQPPNVRLWMEA
jgi:hypothetical protein